MASVPGSQRDASSGVHAPSGDHRSDDARGANRYSGGSVEQYLQMVQSGELWRLSKLELIEIVRKNGMTVEADHHAALLAKAKPASREVA
ncbi:MAG TPA: hypothetical protein VIX60_04665 [Candidatus Cybelea sp.]